MFETTVLNWLSGGAQWRLDSMSYGGRDSYVRSYVLYKKSTWSKKMSYKLSPEEKKVSVF